MSTGAFPALQTRTAWCGRWAHGLGENTNIQKWGSWAGGCADAWLPIPVPALKSEALADISAQRVACGRSDWYVFRHSDAIFSAFGSDGFPSVQERHTRP